MELRSDSSVGIVARPEPVEGARYVARQAILDAAGRVHGYELLFRGGPKAPSRTDQEQAARAILDQTVVYGLERLTGGLPAFVSCTEQTLPESLAGVMLPSMTVLEIKVTQEPTPELLLGARQMKASGFRLALSGFWWNPGCEMLTKLADYLKVDFGSFYDSEKAPLRERVRQGGATLIADNVFTQEDYRRARGEGFKLFQGDYFCRPELLKNRAIPANRVAQIQLLHYLQSSSLNMHELGKMMKLDTALSYRLLRFVNSPSFAIRQEVRSIETALLIAGQDAFQRIVMLALAGELNSSGSAVVLLLSLVRARFCEQTSHLCDLLATEQYMLGMLSLLPVMLRVAMGDLVPSLPLRPEIREALLGSSNRERILLGWLEFYERGDWDECDSIAEAHGLDGQQLADKYTEAVCWAETMANSAK